MEIITIEVVLVITCDVQRLIGSVDNAMNAAACHPAANAITFLSLFVVNENMPIASDRDVGTSSLLVDFDLNVKGP